MKSLMTTSAVALAATLLLSACMLGGGETRYRLIAPQVEPVQAPDRESAEVSLAVARPEADRTRDSSRILVRRDRTLLPWTGAAWIDRAPDLVQDLLVAYLDGRVATVGRYGSLPGAYRLDLVLRRFEFAEGAEGLRAELALVARLFTADGSLLDVVTLRRSESSGNESIDEAVSAMETAMRAVFDELAEWLRPRLASQGASDSAAGKAQ